MSAQNYLEYKYSGADGSYAHSYLWPSLVKILEVQAPPPTRLFDLGCGNGSIANRLYGLGYQVTGVDPSESGIRQARTAFPGCDFHEASGYNDLAGRFGQFPVVVTLEVVEHLYDPRLFCRRLFDLLCPGGLGVLSTPYHGYGKNLALAVTGKMDAHFTALWDSGHIKFFSPRTITTLLSEAGFDVLSISRSGRVPILAKSMFVTFRRPCEIGTPG